MFRSPLVEALVCSPPPSGRASVRRRAHGPLPPLLGPLQRPDRRIRHPGGRGRGRGRGRGVAQWHRGPAARGHGRAVRGGGGGDPVRPGRSLDVQCFVVSYCIRLVLLIGTLPTCPLHPALTPAPRQGPRGRRPHRRPHAPGRDRPPLAGRDGEGAGGRPGRDLRRGGAGERRAAGPAVGATVGAGGGTVGLPFLGARDA